MAKDMSPFLPILEENYLHNSPICFLVLFWGDGLDLWLTGKSVDFGLIYMKVISNFTVFTFMKPTTSYLNSLSHSLLIHTVGMTVMCARTAALFAGPVQNEKCEFQDCDSRALSWAQGSSRAWAYMTRQIILAWNWPLLSNRCLPLFSSESWSLKTIFSLTAS